MAPLLPLITLAISLLSPLAAHAFGEDLNDFMADHRAAMDRQHERQMESYRQAERESNFRAQQDTERMNRPQAEPEPSWTSPNPAFGVYGADGSMQVCRKGSGNNVYCW